MNRYCVKVWVGEKTALDGDFIFGVTANGKGAAVQSVVVSQPLPAGRAFSLRLEGYARHPDTGAYRWVELGRAQAHDAAKDTVTIRVSGCSKEKAAKPTYPDLCNATCPIALTHPCSGPVCTHEYSLPMETTTPIGRNVSQLVAAPAFPRNSTHSEVKLQGTFGNQGQHSVHTTGETDKAFGSLSEGHLKVTASGESVDCVSLRSSTVDLVAKFQCAALIRPWTQLCHNAGEYSFSLQFAGAAELWIESGLEASAKMVQVLQTVDGQNAAFTKGTTTVRLDAGHL